MTEAEMDELRFLLILSKMKENDKVANVLAGNDKTGIKLVKN